MLKNKLSLFVIATICLLAFSNCGEETAQDNGHVDPLPPEGYSATYDTLDENSPNEDGYYYKSYEVEGTAESTYWIDVTSSSTSYTDGASNEIVIIPTFNPHVFLYYGDQLITEAYGEEVYEVYYETGSWGAEEEEEEEKLKWKASIFDDQPLAITGIYTIVVTTTEEGATGKFSLEYFF